MKKKVSNLPVPAKMSSAVPMSPETLGFFKEVINARKEYAIVKDQESTKRTAIMARMKVQLEDMAIRRELFSDALEKSFGSRKEQIDRFFALIEQALAEDKDEVAIRAVAAIEGIVRTSPIADAAKILGDHFDRDDGVIDI
jgi:hypothetical protein